LSSCDRFDGRSKGRASRLPRPDFDIELDYFGLAASLPARFRASFPGTATRDFFVQVAINVLEEIHNTTSKNDTVHFQSTQMDEPSDTTSQTFSSADRIRQLNDIDKARTPIDDDKKKQKKFH
jgi:hypothetical protein